MLALEVDLRTFGQGFLEIQVWPKRAVYQVPYAHEIPSMEVAQPEKQSN